MFTGGHLLLEGFDLPELLRATAWRTSALKADSSTSSPSWMSIAAYVSVETRVEETGWILQRRALGEGKLHDILVGFASADDAVVRPNRRAHPLPLLDRVRVRFLDERAHSAEGFSAPVPQVGDSFRNQLRCRLAMVRSRPFQC